jgi:hypothetical protein
VANNSAARRIWICLATVWLGAVVSCEKTSSKQIDHELASLGSAEITAELVEIPGEFPANDFYNYAYVFKYRVLKVHRGQVNGSEIFVAHYNPLKPRATVGDEFSGKVGGKLERFRAGETHRMALEEPLDKFWMGGIIDKYFENKGTRYWAVWTNPGEP